MENYKQIDSEISSYENEIERLRQKCEELAAARQKIAEAELAEAVEKVIALGGYATKEPKKKPVTSRLPSTGPKKYLNPENGVEWSGQGSMPDWIFDGNKEKFINPAWTAHQASKKHSKQNQASNEPQIAVTSKPDTQILEVLAPSGAPATIATQANQMTSVTEGNNSAMLGVDANSEKALTDKAEPASPASPQ